MDNEIVLMDETTAELKKANKRYNEIREDIHEFSQGVTNFQIENFITNGEGGVDRFPVHTYRHLLAQVRPLISEIRRVAISKERKLREIQRINDKLSDVNNREENDLDLDLIELEFAIEEMNIDLKGKWEVYQTYDKLLSHIRDKYGPFTNKQLQKDEAEYWRWRLSKQMIDSREGATTGYGSGNINSVRMAVQGSPIPDSVNKLDNFELDHQKMIDTVLSNKNTKRLS